MPTIQTRWKSPATITRLPGGEHVAPTEFTATIGGPPLRFAAEMDLVVSDGRAHCRSLCIHAPDDDVLRVADLKRIALKRWCVDALAAVAMRVEPDGGFGFPIDVSEDRAVRLSQGRESQRLPLDDPARLAKVAEIVEGHDGRSFVKAVADQLNITRPHAQRLVDIAREKGLVQR